MFLLSSNLSRMSFSDPFKFNSFPMASPAIALLLLMLYFTSLRFTDPYCQGFRQAIRKEHQPVSNGRGLAAPGRCASGA
jgi:hypothetical protein